MCHSVYRKHWVALSFAAGEPSRVGNVIGKTPLPQCNVLDSHSSDRGGYTENRYCPSTNRLSRFVMGSPRPARAPVNPALIFSHFGFTRQRRLHIRLAQD